MNVLSCYSFSFSVAKVSEATLGKSKDHLATLASQRSSSHREASRLKAWLQASGTGPGAASRAQALVKGHGAASCALSLGRI